MSRFIRRAMLFCLLAGGLAAQTTLYVTVGPYFYSFNALTGAPIAAPLGNTNSYTWESALDGKGQLYVALYGQAQVGVYNATTGATINQTFLQAGANTPTGLALWGNNLYVASQSQQRVSLYDATTGALTSANFLTGFASPEYLLSDGAGRLYVSDYSGTVSVFDATTGAAINRNLVTGIAGVPMGMAVNTASNRLYVASVQGNSVAVYDATTGAVISSNLISGLSSPRALALDPTGALYVSSYNSVGGYYQVGSFDSLTGAAINPALLINGGSITSLNVLAVPEPATWVCLVLGVVWLGCRGWWRRAT
ncbi:MAG: PQQ-binding-like beta-propeller repeat protein [Candidatus Didemnitutus sp.]|nr:PQQ-binding-like beta-propeller repeat protein [Candidatus Didemnitutus sp.]